jgi:DNA-binding XRE family transcriptional regulator/quercetin dioxygenase-like cupin family protein
MAEKPSARGQVVAMPPALGYQLGIARKEAGLTLRELARRLGVSPSLLSQIENGKSQPSVATLYALAQTLEISIDSLFEIQDSDLTQLQTMGEQQPGDGANVVSMSTVLHSPLPVTGSEHSGSTGKRPEVASLSKVWHGGGGADRLSITTPGDRMRLVMESGVIWEQLATNTALQLDFMEITYPPGSTSTSDERMLQHEGFEYGYVLEGEFEITLGFDVFTLRAGEAMGLNSSVPHLLRNRGTVPARGIWCVHHRHD